LYLLACEAHVKRYSSVFLQTISNMKNSWAHTFSKY
jgi:hypothetical protein